MAEHENLSLDPRLGCAWACNSVGAFGGDHDRRIIEAYWQFQIQSEDFVLQRVRQRLIEVGHPTHVSGPSMPQVCIPAHACVCTTHNHTLFGEDTTELNA